MTTNGWATEWTRENDTYLGPFTWAREPTRDRWSWSVLLNSGRGSHYSASRPYLRLTWLRRSLLVSLPLWLLKPRARRVNSSVVVPGRDTSYVEYDVREYGASYGADDGFLQVFYGPQDRLGDRGNSWSKFVPWRNTRMIRHDYYRPDGSFHCEAPKYHIGRGPAKEGTVSFEEAQAITEAAPVQTFAFKDFDGELLTATCRVEEREWRYGTGWFEWVSWVRAPIVRRYIDISFSGETGKRKGSWKGGTVGHSHDMDAGDSVAWAFEDYCHKNGMTFLHEVK